MLLRQSATARLADYLCRLAFDRTAARANTKSPEIVAVLPTIPIMLPSTPKSLAVDGGPRGDPHGAVVEYRDVRRQGHGAWCL